jgi:hypothetical protein
MISDKMCILLSQIYAPVDPKPPSPLLEMVIGAQLYGSSFEVLTALK